MLIQYAQCFGVHILLMFLRLLIMHTYLENCIYRVVNGCKNGMRIYSAAVNERGKRTHLSWNEKNVNPFLQPYKSENEKEPFSII